MFQALRQPERAVGNRGIRVSFEQGNQVVGQTGWSRFADPFGRLFLCAGNERRNLLGQRHCPHGDLSLCQVSDLGHKIKESGRHFTGVVCMEGEGLFETLAFLVQRRLHIALRQAIGFACKLMGTPIASITVLEDRWQIEICSHERNSFSTRHAAHLTRSEEQARSMREQWRE